VIVPSRYFMAAAAGLWMALPLPGQEPAGPKIKPSEASATNVAPSANQRLADTIVERLQQDGQLHHYTVTVFVKDGTAKLVGNVADQAQHEEVLHLVQGVPGVERVLDEIKPARAASMLAENSAAPGQLLPVDQLIKVAQTAPAEPLAAAQEQFPMPQKLQPPQVPSAGPAISTEPQPIYQTPMPGPYDLNPPRMPPYAWPTYAPYNNYSRVAYPTAYPAQAFPFIGPCYPFPKVPLGWRSVKLEWQDGHWWFGKVANSHDWWRLRYW